MPEGIAKYNEVRMMNPMLQATEPFKLFKGYREPNHFSHVSVATGSTYGSIGMARAVGPCRFYGTLKQKPLMRDPSIRLWNRIQGMVIDDTLQGQQMYDARWGMPRYSKNISL